MSQLVRFLARNLPFGPYAQFLKGQRDPVAAQDNCLRNLLTKAKDTEFGKTHRFAAILNAPDLISAYQKQVPLAMDADLRPALDRMLHQEPEVLWPGVSEFGAFSGGTTSHGKYFPVSPEKVRDHQQFGLATTLSFLAETGDRSFLRGKILTLGGSLQKHPDYPEILTGETSAVMSHHASGKPGVAPPKWMAFPPHLADGLSWDEKLTAVADHTLDQDIRMIAFMPSWGLVLLRRVLERFEFRHKRRVETVGEVWPNLKLIIAGGVPLSAYRDKLDEVIGKPDVTIRETYAATQGVMAFQAANNDQALSLWVNGGTFFEFVPWENFNDPNPPRHTLSTIQPDVQYVPFQTTCAGLWSYCLGDIVRFTSVKPPQLLVVGRTSEMLDSVGEGVVTEHVLSSLNFASKALESVVSDYHLAPNYADQDTDYGHQLIVEFEKSPLNLAGFVEAYDQELRRINSRYAEFRQNRGFALPEIVSVPQGTFQRWLENSRSEIHSQSKILHLSQDRTVADSLVNMSANRTAVN